MMEKYKILIVEDDVDLREGLSFSFSGDGYDVTETGTKQDGLHEIANGGYDIVFLDIDMKEMNGLEAAAWFRKLNEQSKVIFVSSHVEYTLDAFKVAAFRYIIKNKDTMTQAVQEALDACLDINPEIKQVKKYHFTELDMFLQTEDIIYIESILHDLKFHIQAESNYVFTLARCTLNIWEQENHWNGFVRIHQSYLVNMKYVYAYNSKEVELLDGTVLTISKQRKTEVCKLFRDQAIPRRKRHTQETYQVEES